MKRFLTLALCSVFALPAAWANGEGLTIREKAQGTARIDEEYTDELKVRDAALEKKSQTQTTRRRFESNPRNPAMVESFEKVSPQDKRRAKEKQEARESKAQGEDYDTPRVWR